LRNRKNHVIKSYFFNIGSFCFSTAAIRQSVIFLIFVEKIGYSQGLFGRKK
jgi:hypothetical protein